MKKEGGDLVAFTNIADDDATIFHLVKAGYGTVGEIEQWDTPRLLDAVEFEMIQRDIELYHMQKPRG